jgi:tricorn protease
VAVFSSQLIHKEVIMQGYYRYPSVHHEQVVFVSEDDLWSVPLKGGKATRLTSNLGAVSFPLLSPDGKWIAFSGREEGITEICVMPAGGGLPAA